MSEWKEVKLSELIDIGNGKKKPNLTGNVPIYGGNGILGYTAKFNYTDETIIIGRVGAYCGSTYYENKPIWVSDNALAVKAKNNNSTKFVYYFLKHIDLNQHAGGSSHPLLTQTLINSLEYLVCKDTNIQKAIAEVLTSLDDKIDLLHRQNQTLEKMAETLFRQWFIEEADDSWEEVKLSDIAEVKNGFSFKSKNYIEYEDNALEVLKMGHIAKDGGLRDNPKRDYVNRENNLEKYILNKGDIIMAMTDMKDNVVILGVPAIIDKSNHYVLNQRVARIYLKSKTKLIDNTLLYIQLKDKENIAILQSKANSGVQVNLSTQSIKDIDIIVPPINLQNKKGNIIIDLYHKMGSNDIEIKNIEKLRDMLIPKLMSGEVRVVLNQ